MGDFYYKDSEPVDGFFFTIFSIKMPIFENCNNLEILKNLSFYIAVLAVDIKNSKEKVNIDIKIVNCNNVEINLSVAALQSNLGLNSKKDIVSYLFESRLLCRFVREVP